MVKNYLYIRINNNIDWHDRGVLPTIADVLRQSKPAISSHTLDSLCKLNFQKSYRSVSRESEGPFAVVADLIRTASRMGYWYDDLKEKGFGIASRNELVIDKRKADGMPDLLRDWLGPIIASESRDSRLKELGI